jgi:hypothetical protein
MYEESWDILRKENGFSYTKVSLNGLSENSTFWAQEEIILKSLRVGSYKHTHFHIEIYHKLVASKD